MERLRRLLERSDENRGKFWTGYKPKHYKRLSISFEEADRLAKFGQTEVLTYYAKPVMLYYTQAVIAGAMIEGSYDTITIVCPSQYGKSYLMGHIAPILAYNGIKLGIAAATTPTTEIIMSQTRAAITDLEEVMKKDLTGETKRKVDRLDSSLSRTRIGFAGRGYIETLTLGDTFENIGHNRAVGRGISYIIDEAALVSDQALNEVGRRELSRTDGKKELLVMISNPHKPGTFYDALTGEADDKTLIIWMDALTACQEGRWTPEQVLKSEFAKHTDTRLRYWMCELPTEGVGMFPEPTVGEPFKQPVVVLGVDSAYKGKDNIEVCEIDIEENRLFCPEIATVYKKNWVDGVTHQQIIDDIARVYWARGAALICVDVGQGIWLTQGLIAKGCQTIGINFAQMPTKERVKARHYSATQAANVRAEMHLDLQSLMDEGLLTFTKDIAEGLREVLPYVTYERRASGKILIRPKAELKALIGHSPDKLDALLLAIHAAILLAGE